MGSTCSTVQVVERGGRYGGGEGDDAGMSDARTLESLASVATTQDAPATVEPPSMCITLTNVRENEAVTHPLVMLEGYVENMPLKQNSSNRSSNDSSGGSCAYIQASFRERGSNDNNSSRRGGLCWPVVPATGHFKAFVLLPKPGAYAVHLQIASVSFVLNVRFAQLPTKYFVRFHYQKPYDSNQGFDAPTEVDSSDNAAIDRIKLNALVLQAALAELLQQAGGHRKTFALELGDDGLPVVHLLRSQYSTAHARKMEDDELLLRLRQDVMETETRSGVNRNSTSSHNEDDRSSQQQLYFKHVVILGGAHFDRHTREIFGHKELADGNLVVFGSCGLHTWPRALEELTACCLNNTRFLPQVFLRDCAGRGSYWAKYASAISRLLQLLGNSFGLAYQREGVMSAGFYELNRLLAVFEPTALVHVSTFSHPIGDGRFSLLDQSALVAVDAENPDDDEEFIVYLDDISLDALTVKCAWIVSRSRRRSSSLEPRRSAAAA